MDEKDIWRAAEQMLKLHGKAASIHAALRAELFFDLGNIEGFHAWKRIMDRIADLERDKPSASKTLN